VNGQDAALLDVRELVVTFGGLRAVDSVSLRVPRGAVVGLIGPNGAGKSTLIDAVTGFVPTRSGSVTFDGEPITRLSAHRRARRGLARTFQTLELFEDLTVTENVRVPTDSGHWWRNLVTTFAPRRRRDAPADAVLDQLGLQPLARNVPSVLSQADRRGLALARALAIEPKLVLLDEPAAGLDATGARELATRLRELSARSAILLVDHDMSLVLGVCDYVYVLDAGRLIAEGTPAEVRRDPEVLRSYLGEEPPAGSTGPIGAGRA
jgi:branched-chain amino acid transport system ATP-binding protein